MKTLFIKSIIILITIYGFSVKPVSNQVAIDLVETVVYDGFDDLGFNFSYMDEYDEDQVITFEEVSEVILSEINLKYSKYNGEAFEIAYELVGEEENAVLISIKKID